MNGLRELNCDEIIEVLGGKINLNIYNVTNINSPIISIDISEQDSRFFDFLIGDAGTISKTLLFCSDYYGSRYNSEQQSPPLVYCFRGQG
jgi:hypothetical protein